jgi:transcription elongation factor GreA
VAARPGAVPADVLSALGVLAEVRRHVGDAAPPVSDALVADRAALAGVLGSIRNDDLARRAFALIREAMPAEWPEVFAAAMPACSQEVCEQVAADLSGAGRDDLLASAAAAIIRQPHQCITALAWLWKTAGQGKFAGAFGGISLAQATVRLLAGVNEVALVPTDDRQRQLDLLNQIRRTISAKDFAILRDILDHTDSGWAKEIRAAASRNSGLTDHIRIQVLEVLGKAHPVPVTKIVPPWEEEVIYTTAAALEARQKEFEEVIHVKLPQNSAAIGAAAALGDVSDNAEFQSALEERGRLTERANAMQADIVKAKPIPRIMAQSETVNIGTTVRARRLSTGQEETLTFLGPWDSAAEKGIYYYRAPMALAFMGKAVGETVTLRTETTQEQWEISEIRPAI